MSAAPRLRMTADEFVAWEMRQETRHEYYRGVVFPRDRGPDGMAGGTEPHARIITNTLLALFGSLRDSGCFVYTDALSVRVETEDLFTYPDLSVVCGQAEFYDEANTQLLNPTVMVEVLSPSTKTYDRTTTWRFYCQIPSLQVYLLISQDSPAIDGFVLDDGTWRAATDQDGVLEVAPLGVTIGLGAIYDGVAFPDPESFDRPVPR